MSASPVPATALTAESLDDFEMMRGVGVGDRRELLACASERSLAEGEVLIERGRQLESMFLVVDCELTVHLEAQDSEPVATIGHGEVVGELSMLDGSAASAWVVAKTAGRVLAVKEEDFWQLINASHPFAVNLLVKLAARLRANNSTVAQNVQKRRLYERAAMFDGLTGVHNRRWLDETLHRLVRRHDEGGSDLSVALIDIDHFKGFNDKYGHAAGDHVLSEVAAILAANLRPTDLVARFGGEEFVIIFPETALKDAHVAAERVRAAVEGTALVMPEGTELPRVTISVGVAQLKDRQSVPELLKAADLAMYQAKQGGRNRVVLAG